MDENVRLLAEGAPKASGESSGIENAFPAQWE
jgi:hypothetical protein